jgi:hypothetical protein
MSWIIPSLALVVLYGTGVLGEHHDLHCAGAFAGDDAGGISDERVQECGSNLLQKSQDRYTKMLFELPVDTLDHVDPHTQPSTANGADAIKVMEGSETPLKQTQKQLDRPGHSDSDQASATTSIGNRRGRNSGLTANTNETQSTSRARRLLVYLQKAGQGAANFHPSFKGLKLPSNFRPSFFFVFATVLCCLGFGSFVFYDVLDLSRAEPLQLQLRQTRNVPYIRQSPSTAQRGVTRPPGAPQAGAANSTRTMVNAPAPQNPTSNECAAGTMGSAPTCQISRSVLAAPSLGDVETVATYLNEELVVPEKSECLLAVPWLAVNPAGHHVKVRVDDQRGTPVFLAALSSGLAPRLSLSSAIGDALFSYACSADSGASGRRAGSPINSLAFYHHSGAFYGNLSTQNRHGVGKCFTMLTQTGWGFCCLGDSEKGVVSIKEVDEHGRLLAIMEPKHDPPSRMVTIGPDVDAGLVVLTILGMDFLNCEQLE